MIAAQIRAFGYPRRRILLADAKAGRNGLHAHVHHDASSPYQGDLVNEHSTNRSHVLWQKGDIYNNTTHRQYWKLAAWTLGTGLD